MINLDKIQKIVSCEFNIPIDTMMSKCRRQDIVEARRVCAYLFARLNIGFSNSMLAREFGINRNILSFYICRCEDDIRLYPKKKEQIKRMINEIKQESGSF